MHLKLVEYLCVFFFISKVKSQRGWGSSNTGYNSGFSNPYSTSNNKPLTANTYGGGSWKSDFFIQGGRPNDRVTGNNKQSDWGYEGTSNTDDTSSWNSKKPESSNNGNSDDWQTESFNNRPNKEKQSFITNLPITTSWNTNSNSLSSDVNKENNFASSWESNNVKPSFGQNSGSGNWNSNYKSKPTGNIFSQSSEEVNSSWSSNNKKKNQPTSSAHKNPGDLESTTQKYNKNSETADNFNQNNLNTNDVFSESNNEDNSLYSSWSSYNNKKPKPTTNSNGNSGKWESTTQKNKKKAQKPSGSWDSNTSQSEKEETLNSNTQNQNKPSKLDTSILDKLDNNNWYFGKESNYPNPPFRSTLNIDVSELWNFDKNKKSNQNSQESGQKIYSNGKNNGNKRRNRQIKSFVRGIDRIQCECVDINFCENEDIITQEDVKFDAEALEELTCPEVTEVCCKNLKVKMTNRASFQKEQETLRCGQRKMGNLFEGFGGNIAEPGEFPWNLKVKNAEMSCSASLIHHKMAMTAAHCVTETLPGELSLQAGLWNSNDEPFQERKVSKIIPHPDYNSKNPRNDIALLVLETPFQLTDNVNPICLPVTYDKWDSNNCIVAGWKTEEIRGEVSRVLEKGIVNFRPQTECQNIMLVTDLWRNYLLHDSFICGWEKNGGKSCIGDEGGFVICASKNRPDTYVQVGIISKGMNCDEFGRPGIFTNVLKFLDWINDNYFELGLIDDIDIRSLQT